MSSVKVSIQDNLLELTLVHPVYKTVTKISRCKQTGELMPQEQQKLVKELKVKKWFSPEQIGSVEEVVNTNNTISKTRSMIYCRFSAKFYITWHAPKDVILQRSTLMKPQRSKIGY
jgi:hypothetical protein